MKKRFLAAFLALALFCTLLPLGSAATRSGPEKTYDVTVWVAGTIVDLTKKQIEDFNTQNAGSLHINAVIEEVGEGEAANYVLNPTDETPVPADLFCFAQDQTARLASAKALSAVDDATAKIIADNNSAGSVAAAKIGEKTYAYPLTADNGYFMYYDKSVIPAEDVGSLEKLIADCEAAGRKFSMELTTSAWYGASFFFGTGCVSEWQVGADGTFTGVNDTFNSEAGLAAAKGMKKLLASPCYKASSDGSDFADGESAVVVAGTWAYGTVAEILGENLGAAELPSFEVDGKQYHLGSFNGCKLMGVRPQEDLEKEAALHKLALYLTDEMPQAQRFEEVGWGPSNLAVQQYPAVKENPVLAALFKQNNACSVPQGQIHGAWWSIGTELTNAIAEATDEAGLKAALQAYADALASLFDELPPVPVTPTAAEFDDVEPGSWYYDAADFIIRTGFMGSTSQTENTFAPYLKVSRAMVASIMYRIAGSMTPPSKKGAFTDLEAGSWYETAVEWCAANGLATGRGNGVFDPNGDVTRQELAVFMYKLAEFLGRDVSAAADLTKFPDYKDVPDWAAKYLAWAVGVGLITGKGQADGSTLLAPVANAMRCELASILQRFLENKTPVEPPETGKMKVALITDMGEIDDGSYSQACWEGVKAFCDKNGTPSFYVKPSFDSAGAFIEAVETAIRAGANALVLPGWTFGEPIAELQDKYPDVYFLGIDMYDFDLTTWPSDADEPIEHKPSKNTVLVSFKEEEAGFLAGYAAVAMGYTKLGFVGGMPTPPILRYGFGFVQGADFAAEERGKTDAVEVKYGYANQFYANDALTGAMEQWYTDGTEIIFACGGGLCLSVIEAAEKLNGKMIGVDIDQGSASDCVITSAMKNLSAAVLDQLNKIKDGTFEGGKEIRLGVIDGDSDKNYVRLAPTTKFNENFKAEDVPFLNVLLSSGEVVVSDDTSRLPEVQIKFDYIPNILSAE